MTRSTYTAINIQNQVVLLRGSDSLDSDRIVEKFVGGEVLHYELLDQFDSEIRVVAGLDTVTNARNYDWLV